MFCHCISTISQKSKSASYLDLHIEIDNRGRLKTDPSDRRDDLIFSIINFPLVSNNISSTPSYGVFFTTRMFF